MLVLSTTKNNIYMYTFTFTSTVSLCDHFKISGCRWVMMTKFVTCQRGGLTLLLYNILWSTLYSWIKMGTLCYIICEWLQLRVTRRKRKVDKKDAPLRQDSVSRHRSCIKCRSCAQIVRCKKRHLACQMLPTIRRIQMTPMTSLLDACRRRAVLNSHYGWSTAATSFIATYVTDTVPIAEGTTPPFASIEQLEILMTCKEVYFGAIFQVVLDLLQLSTVFAPRRNAPFPVVYHCML